MVWCGVVWCGVVWAGVMNERGRGGVRGGEAVVEVLRGGGCLGVGLLLGLLLLLLFGLGRLLLRLG